MVIQLNTPYLYPVSKLEIILKMISKSATFQRSRPTVRVLSDAILFVQAATKRMQKMPVSLRRAIPLPDLDSSIRSGD